MMLMVNFMKQIINKHIAHKFFVFLCFYMYLKLGTLFAQELQNGNMVVQSFRLSSGEEFLVQLPELIPVVGKGGNSFITVEPGQRFSFVIMQDPKNKKFIGWDQGLPADNDEVKNHLQVYLAQDYDKTKNMYSSARILLNFRGKGWMLRCVLEAYIVEKQEWQKIGKLRLKGDISSDQFHIQAVVARIRLSNFQLRKY